MTVEYKIIRAKDFIRARPAGELDLEQSKKILKKIAAIAEPPADYEILLDVRDVNLSPATMLTDADLYELIGVLVEHRQSFRNKICILTRPDSQLGRAEFAELCARNRGFFMDVFADFETAIEWLQTAVEIEK